jgi:uncharacterized membrane protein
MSSQVRERDAWLYAAIALPFALLFAFLTPPFQSPDEVGHYWRAMAISRGSLRAVMVAGRPGDRIPADARDLVATLWMDLAGKEQVKFDRAKFRDARALRPSDPLVSVSFPAFYTAVPYTPQALALVVTRRLHCPTLVGFYAGRVLNAIVGVLLVMLAMRMLPDAAWVFACAGLTPMFLYLAGTFSADVVTAGLAFCATAAALRPIKAAFPAFAGLLSLAKPGYALIALLALPRLRQKRERVAIAIAFVAVALGGWLATMNARDSYFPMRSDIVTDARAQATNVAHAPLRFLNVAAADYAHHAWAYLDQLIGRLGWLDIGLPSFVIYAYLALFLFVALSLSVRFGIAERAMLAMVFVATLLTLSLAQYLIWSPVGGSEIEGLQGRYFIPAVPLLLLAISAPWLRGTRWAICAIAIPGNAIALVLLARRYYGWP